MAARIESGRRPDDIVVAVPDYTRAALRHYLGPGPALLGVSATHLPAVEHLVARLDEAAGREGETLWLTVRVSNTLRRQRFTNLMTAVDRHRCRRALAVFVVPPCDLALAPHLVGLHETILAELEEVVGPPLERERNERGLVQMRWGPGNCPDASVRSGPEPVESGQE